MALAGDHDSHLSGLPSLALEQGVVDTLLHTQLSVAADAIATFWSEELLYFFIGQGVANKQPVILGGVNELVLIPPIAQDLEFTFEDYVGFL